MADPQTDTYWQDGFERADAVLDNEWSTSAGNLQIVDGAVQQSGASAAAEADLYRAVSGLLEAAPADYRVGIIVSCDDDATKRSAEILVRWDPTTEDGYGIRLSWDGSSGAEALTIDIRKHVAGVASTLDTLVVTNEAATVSSTYDDVLQRLGVDIYDQDGSVFIEALFESEDSPALVYEDRKTPQFGQAGSVGVRFSDADAGVDGHIKLGMIAIGQIQSSAPSSTLPQPSYWNYGNLITSSRNLSLRGSSSSLEDDFWGELVNEAVVEMCEHAGMCPWLEEVHSFKLRAGQETYEMPADTSMVDRYVWDTDNKRALAIHNESQFRTIAGVVSQGTPYMFRMVGAGPSGGPLLRPYQIPSTDGNYQVLRWRTPRLMVNTGDLPDLPMNFRGAVRWGVAHQHATVDESRHKARTTAAKWEVWLRRIRKAARRQGTVSSEFHIQTGLHRGVFQATAQEVGRYGIRGRV